MVGSPRQQRQNIVVVLAYQVDLDLLEGSQHGLRVLQVISQRDLAA